MQAICLHLERHPMAGDTAQGIHDWWIGWQEPRPPLEVTMQALQQLRDQQHVQCVPPDDEERGLWRRRG